MKFIKQDLLTLLIGLFLFSACKSTNTVGIDPDPGSAIEGDLKVLPLNSTTVAEEITSTTGIARYPLGYISADPIFGSTEAGLAMTVSLPNIGYSFGDDPLIDSAVLVLPYASSVAPSTITHLYGDTATSVYSFDVQQLEEDLTLQKTYLSNKNYIAKDPIIGSFTAKVRPNSKVTITDVVAGKVDTTRLLPTPQIRIRLDNAFIQTNILNLDSATKSKNSKFTGAFKGLKISVNKAKTTGPGGIMFFNFSSTDDLTGSRPKIEIYYKKLQENSQIQRDTASVYFPIDPQAGPVAATVTHDYTGTPVKTQLDAPNPATPYNVTYLQALAGLRNKISVPGLKQFADSIRALNANSKIVVNKAELVVNVSSGTDAAPYLPAERLSLYRLDVAGQRIDLTDNVPGSPGNENPRYAGSPEAFGGFYDKTNKRYMFTVTAYVQELIDGTTQDYGTYIAPSSYTEFDMSSTVSSGSRTVISSKSPAPGNKPIKLNIYYTKTN